MTKIIKPEFVSQLTLLYPNADFTVVQIAEILGVSKHTVAAYAQRLGLRRPKTPNPNSFSKEKEALIRAEYPAGDLDLLAEKLNMKVHAISEWARKRNIKREIDIRRKGSLEPLFSETLESFYWLGYLAADGYVARLGHLMFSQSEKDKDSVYQFATYVGSNVYIYESKSGYVKTPRLVYRVNVCDLILGPKLRKMWGLSDTQTKTYSSITFDFIKTKEQAMAFLIGFFDGDGYRREVISGKIEVHASWFSFLSKLSDKCELQRGPRTNKRGFVELPLLKQDFIALEAFIEEKQLQPNQRKWNYKSSVVKD